MMTNTTEFGRAHCLDRLSKAAIIGRQALAARWGCLGVFYQNDPEVMAHKEALKARVK